MPLNFSVLPNKANLPPDSKDQCFLVEDKWDDYFAFETQFNLIFIDVDGLRHDIGEVKIGQFQMQGRRPPVPSQFAALDDQFFSLGQDYGYYVKLQALPQRIRDNILQGTSRNSNTKENRLRM